MKKATTKSTGATAVKKTTRKKSSAVAKKTKRSPAKKASPKKLTKGVIPVVAIPQGSRPLIVAPDHKSFWTTDGHIINNLRSLAETFAAMDSIIYRYHVDGVRNDFAQWVEEVLDDPSCAASLRKAKTPKTAHTVIVRHLRSYQ